MSNKFIVVADQNNLNEVRKSFESIAIYLDVQSALTEYVRKYQGDHVFFPIWDTEVSVDDIFDIITEDGVVMVCKDVGSDQWDPKPAIIYKLSSGDFACELDDLT